MQIRFNISKQRWLAHVKKGKKRNLSRNNVVAGCMATRKACTGLSVDQSNSTLFQWADYATVVSQNIADNAEELQEKLCLN